MTYDDWKTTPPDEGYEAPERDSVTITLKESEVELILKALDQPIYTAMENIDATVDRIRRKLVRNG